jgi:hypothetical protein
MTFRDVLLVTQVAICAVLVTSSLVAVRGLVRWLHSNLGFEPRNALLVETDLSMAGYSGDRIPEIQKRLEHDVQSIAGVLSTGLVSDPPLALAPNLSPIFKIDQTDLKPASAATTPFMFQISTDYFRAAGTRLLAGRSFTVHDDKDAPRVAVVNHEFARMMFGVQEPVSKALGKEFKLLDGSRVEVAGIVEDGKYFTIAEQPRPAMFLPILQSPTAATWFVVRSDRDPQQLTTELERVRREVDASLPFRIQNWTKELEINLFPLTHGCGSAGCAGHNGCDALNHRNLWTCCLLCQQTDERTRDPHRSWRKAERSLEGRSGTSFEAAHDRLRRRIGPWNSR